jgi:CBS domain-containing protein
MAGNPEWCLSLSEWKQQFSDWVRIPEPQALLNASIFFDLRPLVGDVDLGESLRSQLLSLTKDATAFLHLMAANALQAQAPLNFRGEVVAAGGVSGNQIDLKKFGSRIFVDAARIFALASGVRSVNTSVRLSDSAPSAGFPAHELLAVDAAFSHILRLRLSHQLAAGPAAVEAGQGIPLDSLNDFDKAILKEALRQARRLQQRLKLKYGL